MYFFNRQSLKYKWETDYGLSTDIEIKRESNQPTGGKYVFRKLDTGDIVQKIRMTEVTLGFDYRPGQSYINTKQQRLEVNLDVRSSQLNIPSELTTSWEDSITITIQRCLHTKGSGWEAGDI